MSDQSPKEEKCTVCDEVGEYFAGTLVGYVPCESCSPSHSLHPTWEENELEAWNRFILSRKMDGNNIPDYWKRIADYWLYRLKKAYGYRNDKLLEEVKDAFESGRSAALKEVIEITKTTELDCNPDCKTCIAMAGNIGKFCKKVEALSFTEK